MLIQTQTQSQTQTHTPDTQFTQFPEFMIHTVMADDGGRFTCQNL